MTSFGRLLTALTLLPGVAAPAALAGQVAGSLALGERLFKTRCVACHSVGSDRIVGPGLSGVTARRPRAWLLRWIAAPNRMLSARDSIATQMLAQYNNLQMPNMGLTESDAEAVLAYVESAPAMGAAPAAAPVALHSGNPVIGRGLFTGAIRLRNGGPPCMGCHSVAGIGALGGGALGPDLTPALQKYGEAGLATVLATTPFPTMQPVFGRRPLLPDEQANLRAFLQQAVASRPTRAVAQLSLLAVAGVLVWLASAQLLWRGRLRGVRRSMVRRASGWSDERRG